MFSILILAPRHILGLFDLCTMQILVLPQILVIHLDGQWEIMALMGGFPANPKCHEIPYSLGVSSASRNMYVVALQ